MLQAPTDELPTPGNQADGLETPVDQLGPNRSLLSSRRCSPLTARGSSVVGLGPWRWCRAPRRPPTQMFVGGVDCLEPLSRSSLRFNVIQKAIRMPDLRQFAISLPNLLRRGALV